MVKSEFNKLHLNLSKKLLTCYICSIAFCGAETCTLREVYQKYTLDFEMRYWRRMEKMMWTDNVKNEDVSTATE
jgi:hypothetical protein